MRRWNEPKSQKGRSKNFRTGFLNRGPRFRFGATERVSGGHEQRLPLISSAVILQNPRGTILIIS